MCLHQISYTSDVVAFTTFAYVPPLPPSYHKAESESYESEMLWLRTCRDEPFLRRDRARFEPVTEEVAPWRERYGWHIPGCGRPPARKRVESSSGASHSASDVDAMEVVNFHHWYPHPPEEATSAPMKETDTIVTCVPSSSSSDPSEVSLSQSSTGTDGDAPTPMPMKLVHGPKLQVDHPSVHRLQTACRSMRRQRLAGGHRSSKAAPITNLNPAASSRAKVEQMRVDRAAVPLLSALPPSHRKSITIDADAAPVPTKRRSSLAVYHRPYAAYRMTVDAMGGCVKDEPTIKDEPTVKSESTSCTPPAAPVFAVAFTASEVVALGDSNLPEGDVMAEATWYRLMAPIEFNALLLERRDQARDDMALLIAHYDAEEVARASAPVPQFDDVLKPHFDDVLKPPFLAPVLTHHPDVYIEVDELTADGFVSTIDEDVTVYRIDVDVVAWERSMGLDVSAKEQHSLVTALMRETTTVSKFASLLNDAIARRTLSRRDFEDLFASLEEVVAHSNGIEMISYVLSRFDTEEAMLRSPGSTLDEGHELYECGLLGRLVASEQHELYRSTTFVASRFAFDGLLRAVVEHTPTRVVNRVLRYLEVDWNQNAYSCVVIAHAVAPTGLMYPWVDDSNGEQHLASCPSGEDELTMEHVIAIQLHHGMRHGCCFDGDGVSVPFEVDRIVDRYVRTRYRKGAALPSVLLDEQAIVECTFDAVTGFTMMHEAAVFRVGKWTARLADAIAAFPSILANECESPLNPINPDRTIDGSIARAAAAYGKGHAHVAKLQKDMQMRCRRGEFEDVDAQYYRSSIDAPLKRHDPVIRFKSPFKYERLGPQAAANGVVPSSNAVTSFNQRDRVFGMSVTMACAQATGLASVYRYAPYDPDTACRHGMEYNVAASVVDANLFVATIDPKYHDFTRVDAITGRTLLLMLVDVGAMSYVERCLAYIATSLGPDALRDANRCDKSGRTLMDAIHASHHAAMKQFGTPMRVLMAVRDGYYLTGDTDAELHARLFAMMASREELTLSGAGSRCMLPCATCKEAHDRSAANDGRHSAAASSSSSSSSSGSPMPSLLTGTCSRCGKLGMQLARQLVCVFCMDVESALPMPTLESLRTLVISDANPSPPASDDADVVNSAASSPVKAPAPPKDTAIFTPFDVARLTHRSANAVFNSIGSWLCSAVLLRSVIVSYPRRGKVDALTLGEAIALVIQHAMKASVILSLTEYKDALRLIFLSCGINASLPPGAISALFKHTAYAHAAPKSIVVRDPLPDTIATGRMDVAFGRLTAAITSVDANYGLYTNYIEAADAFNFEVPFDTPREDVLEFDMRRRLVFESVHDTIAEELALQSIDVSLVDAKRVNAANHAAYMRALAAPKAAKVAQVKRTATAALHDVAPAAAAATASPKKKPKVGKLHHRTGAPSIDIDSAVSDASPRRDDRTRLVDDEAEDDDRPSRRDQSRSSSSHVHRRAPVAAHASKERTVMETLMRSYIKKERSDFNEDDIRMAILNCRDMSALRDYLNLLSPSDDDNARYEVGSDDDE